MKLSTDQLNVQISGPGTSGPPSCSRSAGHRSKAPSADAAWAETSGPVELVDDDRLVDLCGTKQRAILAILALNANRLVATRRLIDDLWPEQPPESAANTLQGYVSRLRKALGGNGAIAYRS